MSVQNHSLDRLHFFTHSVEEIDLPEKFTNPFRYLPHVLCLKAAAEVQAYLRAQIKWANELKEGKMFGVLVVQTPTGEIGYLAAFSGLLAKSNQQPYFVPPIYDLLHPEGSFVAEECAISDINNRIQLMESDPFFIGYKKLVAMVAHDTEESLAEAKLDMKKAKKARDIRRQQHPDEEELAAMEKESQFQKAEYKRLKEHLYEELARLKQGLKVYETGLEEMKEERKSRSAALQQWLFEQFQLLNARGEVKSLCAVFEETAQKVPPAGAGECAAPKLLQYAYQNHLKPVAMAEFWWGDSPKTEIRQHGLYYPACKGKCEPILNFMLQGLDVENPQVENEVLIKVEPEILYEDQWLLVINKPAGMLSVPGKTEEDSIYNWVQKRYPEATGPLIVHRLDMDTSGVLVVAKTKTVHKHLQGQFNFHTVKKRYVALLMGEVDTEEGTIDLPLCPDLMDRPRQMVSQEYGKPALTHYRVLEHLEGYTLIAFYPVTGRTHQLRVHAAHRLGLNAPIVGDNLYGVKGQRLYLHAESIEFTHPISGEVMCIENKAPFLF